jgi:hypothetical protein
VDYLERMSTSTLQTIVHRAGYGRTSYRARGLFLALLALSIPREAGALTCRQTRVAAPMMGGEAPPNTMVVGLVDGSVTSASLQASDDRRSIPARVVIAPWRDGALTLLHVTPTARLNPGDRYEVLYTSGATAAVKVLTVFSVVGEFPAGPPVAPVLGVPAPIPPNPAAGIPHGAVGIPVTAPGAGYLEVTVDGRLDQILSAGSPKILLGTGIACSASASDAGVSHEVSVVAVGPAGDRSAPTTLSTTPTLAP